MIDQEAQFLENARLTQTRRKSTAPGTRSSVGALGFAAMPEKNEQSQERMKLSNGMTSLAIWLHEKKKTSLPTRLLIILIALFVSFSQTMVAFQLIGTAWDHMQDEIESWKNQRGELMPFYFTNKRWYMLLISIVVGYTIFHDSHSHFAIMMRAKNRFYIFLAFINTVANFYISIAVLFENTISRDVIDIFMNFAGLLVVSQVDNLIADFFILYVPERDEEDFLELPFEKLADDRATRIVRIQIWIYVALNVWLFAVLKKLVYDKDMNYQDDLLVVFQWIAFYIFIGAFVPVFLINFFNRSWCCCCIPRCGKKQKGPSVEIDEDDKNEKLLSKEEQDPAKLKEQEIAQLKRSAKALEAHAKAIKDRVQSVKERITELEREN